MEFIKNHKKIIFIILFLFLSFAMGFFLYQLFFKPLLPITEVTEETNDQQTTGQGLPQADDGTLNTNNNDQVTQNYGESVLPQSKVSEKALGGITKTFSLEENSTISPVLSNNSNNLKYYDQETDKFYQIDENGNKKLLSDKVFHDVKEVTWSNDTQKAVLEYPDGANIVYDFETGTQNTLPKHWEEFDFSPNSDKLISKSIGLDPENRWLLVSDSQGTQIKPLESMGDNEESVYTDWSPNNQIVAMYSKGIDFNRQEIFFVGLNNENFKSTVVEGRGFQSLWSPSGDKLLYSVYSSNNDMKPNLWVVNSSGDLIGEARKNLNTETWANKCTYSSQTEIYCAVPEDLPEGAGMFEELSKTTVDRLYKINTITGQKKLVAIPDKQFNMSNLSVTKDQKTLFFTDQTTGSIHKIQL